MTNLARLITDSAAADPERPAIRLDDAVVPYGGLDHATRRVAGLLAARGIGPGDRVGLMLPTSRTSRSRCTGSCGSGRSPCR